MKNLVYLVAIALLGLGLAMMFINLPFEASLPAWADKAAVGAGVVLGLVGVMGGRKTA
jgi:hypothetical protein